MFPDKQPWVFFLVEKVEWAERIKRRFDCFVTLTWEKWVNLWNPTSSPTKFQWVTCARCVSMGCVYWSSKSPQACSVRRGDSLSGAPCVFGGEGGALGVNSVTWGEVDPASLTPAFLWTGWLWWLFGPLCWEISRRGTEGRLIKYQNTTNSERNTLV